MINFWATWCGPCRAEIPDLVALQEKYRDTLQIIGVSEDEASPEVVKQFAAPTSVNYPIVMMTPELDEDFPRYLARCRRRSSWIARRASCRSTSACSTRCHRGGNARAGRPAGERDNRASRSDAGARAGERRPSTTIPGVDLAKFSVAQRVEALQKLNASRAPADASSRSPDAGSTIPPAASACRSPAKSSSNSPLAEIAFP